MHLIEFNSDEVVDRLTLPGRERFRFRNGYGASVIPDARSLDASHRLLEIAVLRFSGQGPGEFDLCYDTPIARDVLRQLSLSEAHDVLDQISRLPPDAQALPGARL
jgi:hypothetical protein